MISKPVKTNALKKYKQKKKIDAEEMRRKKRKMNENTETSMETVEKCSVEHSRIYSPEYLPSDTPNNKEEETKDTFENSGNISCLHFISKKCKGLCIC